ncbi:hypothetical protein HK170_00360 [Streptococcus agalactiae]|nr:hypothetical protein [Streptococcus agalactiae]MCK6347846.1 hypothetical protein [Streptococcus agalactiae]
MKQETLVLLPNFIGDAIYEGFEAGPAQLNGKKGSYTRHILFNEKHGKFYVYTPASSRVIGNGKMVTVEKPLLFIDTTFNGRNIEPAKNVWAEKLIEVK